MLLCAVHMFLGLYTREAVLLYNQSCVNLSKSVFWTSTDQYNIVCMWDMSKCSNMASCALTFDLRISDVFYRQGLYNTAAYACGTWQFVSIVWPLRFWHLIGVKFHVAMVVHVICSCACMTCAHRPPNHHEMSLPYTRQCASVRRSKPRFPPKCKYLQPCAGEPCQHHLHRHSTKSIRFRCYLPMSREHHVMCLCAVAKR